MPAPVSNDPTGPLPSWVTENPVVAAGPISTTQTGAPINPPAAAPTPPPDPEPPPANPPEPPKTAVEPLKGGEPEPKWPRTAKDWDAFKTAERERRVKLEETNKAIQAELDGLKSKLPKPGETDPVMSKLSTERDEAIKRAEQLDERLRLVDLANHPQFKNYYDGHINAQVALAKQYVGPEKAKQFEEVLNLPASAYRDAQIEEIVSDLSVVKQGQLGAVIGRIQELQSERDAEIKKGQENFNRIQAEREAKVKSAQDATEKLVVDTLANFSQTPEMKGIVSEDDSKLARAITLGGTKDPADVPKIILRGLAYPKALKALAERDEQIKKLEGQITALQAATPSAGHPKALETGKPSEAHKGFVDSMVEHFASQYQQ